MLTKKEKNIQRIVFVNTMIVAMPVLKYLRGIISLALRIVLFSAA